MKDQLCYVCTGRLGDILNILPVLEMDNERGNRAALMVAKEFESILDGVSYLDPVIFDGHWLEVKSAMLEARSNYQRVMLAQVAGPKAEIMKEARAVGIGSDDKGTESFLKDQWKVIGRFQDVKLDRPLLFDRRDPKREEKLVESVIPPIAKRIVLLHLGGTTSPHPYAKIVSDYLAHRFHANLWAVVDISDVQAHRFYDLLGLYEKAYALIAADSAPLHLAQAIPTLPVFALTQDQPNYKFGSFHRKNWVGCCRYHDLNGLVRIYDRLKEERVLKRRFSPKEGPVGVHAFSLYHGNEKLYRAWPTNWNRVEGLNNWIRFSVDPGAFGRDSHTVFKGGARHPFVKDVIRAAGFGRSDDDYIILTRPDCYFRLDIGSKLKLPVCGARMVQEDNLDEGMIHSATDLFAFTFGWWRKHQHDYPDLVMGTDMHWHSIMAHLVCMNGGERRTDLTYRPSTPIVPAHEEAWRDYNAKLAADWMKRKGISDETPQVHTQAPMKRINQLAIFPHGYNPSILPAANGTYIMCYRSHRWNTSKTCLAIAVLNDRFEVKSNEWLDLEPHDQSTEDGRLFYLDGALYLSYVRSNLPEMPMKSEVVYGRFIGHEGKWALDYRNCLEAPFPQDMEKNWIFFSHKEDLYVIYSASPKQIVWKVDGERIEKIWELPGVVWPWGPIRGGTHPIEVNGRWYRLFHSATYGNPLPVRWRYYVGAMEVNPEPPFNCLRVGKKPILEGALNDELSTKPFHHKPNIVFPVSWFLQDDKFKVSLGVNDASSYIATLSIEDLNL